MENIEQTNLTLLGAVFILCTWLLIMFLPKKYVLLPIFMGACFITLGQQVNIFGLNFYAIRLIILVGWVRAFVIRKDGITLKLNSLDKLILLWVVYSITAYTLLHGNWEAFVNRLGVTYDIIGSYFLFRFYMKDTQEMENVLNLYTLIVIVLGCIMVLEYFTGRNIFSIFGGVREFTSVRDGRLRCQGPFTHPILTGTFGGISVPIAIGLAFRKERRIRGLLGCVMGTFIVVASGSIGAVSTFMAGLIGMVMWPFRGKMRVVRYLIVFGLISLHSIMNDPVWYLMAKMSRVMGGYGYHRSALIDQAIHHFGEWWLIGTKSNAHWLPFAVLPGSPEYIDCTNQYISEGINGGLGKMVLFIAIIVVSFKAVGKWVAKEKTKLFTKKIMVWSVGSVLLAHTISFIGVSYFDQLVIFWCLCLASAGAITQEIRTPRQ